MKENNGSFYICFMQITMFCLQDQKRGWGKCLVIRVVCKKENERRIKFVFLKKVENVNLISSRIGKTSSFEEFLEI